MKTSIILELVTDSNRFLDRILPAKNKEYSDCSDEMDAICNELCKDMPEDEKLKMVNRIFMAQCGMETVSAYEHFKEGFKLGLRLAIQNLID